GVTAIYADIRHSFYSYGDFGTMSWAVHGSDLGYMGENPGSAGSYINSYSATSPTIRYVVSTWEDGYRIINEANNLIKGVKKADSANFDGGEKGKEVYIAEGRFFRAWIYRYLISTYGAIPLM